MANMNPRSPIRGLPSKATAALCSQLIAFAKAVTADDKSDDCNGTNSQEVGSGGGQSSESCSISRSARDLAMSSQPTTSMDANKIYQPKKTVGR